MIGLGRKTEENCVGARYTRSEVKDTGGYKKTTTSPARAISNQGIQRGEGYERRGEDTGERGEESNGSGKVHKHSITKRILQSPTQFSIR
jgi:hypothetical protein